MTKFKKCLTQIAQDILMISVSSPFCLCTSRNSMDILFSEYTKQYMQNIFIRNILQISITCELIWRKDKLLLRGLFFSSSITLAMETQLPLLSSACAIVFSNYLFVPPNWFTSICRSFELNIVLYLLLQWKQVFCKKITTW